MNMLSRIFGSAIENFYYLTGDYGIAIVCITLLVRGLMVPFSLKMRSQAERQQATTAEIERIKQQYAKDPERMQEEMQKIYHENGIGSCLMVFLQFPIMMGLYTAIRLVPGPACRTVLIPWISSLLERDTTCILPVVTVLVQMLPQLYPYLRLFGALHLQKPSWRLVFMSLFMNCMYIFSIPSGVGLYVLASGIFQAVEQFLFHMADLSRKPEPSV